MAAYLFLKSYLFIPWNSWLYLDFLQICGSWHQPGEAGAAQPADEQRPAPGGRPQQDLRSLQSPVWFHHQHRGGVPGLPVSCLQELPGKPPHAWLDVHTLLQGKVSVAWLTRYGYCSLCAEQCQSWLTRYGYCSLCAEQCQFGRVVMCSNERKAECYCSFEFLRCCFNPFTAMM